MSLLDLFKTVNGTRWTTSGEDVQYKVDNDVLYFQCSKGWSDWRFNFTASASVYRNSDIEFIGHRGFNELWQSVRSDIENLKFHKIVGYSQGGALAVLAHENFYHRFGFEPDITITFGCPPTIIDPAYRLLARFSRVVNYHNPLDIVYILPMMLGYHHVGGGVALKNKAARQKGCGLLRWLSGHSEEEYLQRLNDE